METLEEKIIYMERRLIYIKADMETYLKHKQYFKVLISKIKIIKLRRKIKKNRKKLYN